MKIDREALNKIAHLARLEFNDRDAEKMMQDMSNIVSWVEKLKEVDTAGVEPLTTMSHEVNAMREDVIGEALKREDALKLAPARDEKYFRVPKVLD
jgi:aspartyl-tRNA(Asn)/glutamyl-tRNA(Gln) amidotransferase subunit C